MSDIPPLHLHHIDYDNSPKSLTPSTTPSCATVWVYLLSLCALSDCVVCCQLAFPVSQRCFIYRVAACSNIGGAEAVRTSSTLPLKSNREEGVEELLRDSSDTPQSEGEGEQEGEREGTVEGQLKSSN